MNAWVYGLIALGVVAVAAVLGAPMRRRIWRRQREASGWADWQRTAATLPWSDRLRLAWANFLGRAVSRPRLATFAATRGDAYHEYVNLMMGKQMFWAVPLAVIMLWAGVRNAQKPDWVLAVSQLVVGVGCAFMWPLMKAEGRRALRSAEANRELAQRQ